MPGLIVILLLLIAGSSAPEDADDALVARSLSAHLAKAFPDMGIRVEVRLLRNEAEVMEGDSIRVVFAGDALPRAHTKMNLFRMTNRGWARAGWALAYVAHYDSVVVSRQAIERDEVVALEDLSSAWMEVTRFHGTPLTPGAVRRLTVGTGAVASRRIAADVALKEGDLRPPLAVSTGSNVSVSYRRDGFALELGGKARQSGRIGDVVRIYCPDTNATYRARVVAPGRTEWIETL